MEQTMKQSRVLLGMLPKEATNEVLESINEYANPSVSSEEDTQFLHLWPNIRVDWKLKQILNNKSLFFFLREFIDDIYEPTLLKISMYYGGFDELMFGFANCKSTEERELMILTDLKNLNPFNDQLTDVNASVESGKVIISEYQAPRTIDAQETEAKACWKEVLNCDIVYSRHFKDNEKKYNKIVSKRFFDWFKSRDVFLQEEEEREKRSTENDEKQNDN